jgi:hypothetical protein
MYINIFVADNSRKKITYDLVNDMINKLFMGEITYIKATNDISKKSIYIDGMDGYYAINIRDDINEKVYYCLNVKYPKSNKLIPIYESELPLKVLCTNKDLMKEIIMEFCLTGTKSKSVTWIESFAW